MEESNRKILTLQNSRDAMLFICGKADVSRDEVCFYPQLNHEKTPLVLFSTIAAAAAAAVYMMS